MASFNLNILIVEDDLSFAIELQMMLLEIGHKVVGRVDNSDNAFKSIQEISPDLILMDIEIEGKLTGIEVAEKIKNKKIPVLFLTSFENEEYYQKAQQTNLIGYLVKPTNKYSLRSAIDMAFKKIIDESGSPSKNTLFLKRNGIEHKVEISKIYFVQANDDYTIIYTEDGKFHSSLRISKIIENLNDSQFFQIHRSYIVNLDKIKSVNVKKNWVEINEQQLPISRINKKLFLQKINMVK